MRLAYLDTSAALKLVVEEDHSTALLAYLTDQPSLTLTASWLLYTEMHCAAGRRPNSIAIESIREVLDQIEFVDQTRNDMIFAARLAPLRSNDAIHLAVAMRLQVDEFITYDRELIEAAPRVALAPVSPE